MPRRIGFIRWAAGRTSVESDVLQLISPDQEKLVEIPISFGCPSTYIQTRAEFFAVENCCSLEEVEPIWMD
jgi:hypothetical protein